MAADEDPTIRKRIEKIRNLSGDNLGAFEWFEAAILAQTVLHDTVGSSHPLMGAIQNALQSDNGVRAVAGARGVVTLFYEGALRSPRLLIAHEIEGSLLDIADSQVQAAERASDPSQKQLRLAVAAFLAGAALEDALRRLCDANEVVYDAQRTTIAKLQTVLYHPSKQIELITVSENKQITVWGDTRNKADHGRFSDLTHSEALTMVIGVRAFLDRHLP